MPNSTRRVVTGHDARGKSVVLSDGSPPQHHPMQGPTIGADFHEMWSEADTIPELTLGAAREPNERPFTIMPVAGHLLRILDVYPLKDGGKRTMMHRTRTLDYVVVTARDEDRAGASIRGLSYRRISSGSSRAARGISIRRPRAKSDP